MAPLSSYCLALTPSRVMHETRALVLLLTTELSFSVHCSTTAYVQLLQLCPTLHNPINCSPPGSSVRGISMARIFEWVAMPSSRVSSRSRAQTHVSCISFTADGALLLSHRGSPLPCPYFEALSGTNQCSVWGSSMSKHYACFFSLFTCYLINDQV